MLGISPSYKRLVYTILYSMSMGEFLENIVIFMYFVSLTRLLNLFVKRFLLFFTIIRVF